MRVCRCLVIGVLLACVASAEAGPYYAGWTVGTPWNGYGTILHSTDSGNTWVRQGEGQIADVYLWGVSAVDPYTAWVVGDSADGYATIYHTNDGGSTWERKGSAGDLPDLDMAKVHATGDTVWAVGNNWATDTSAILQSSDGGATWTQHIPAGYESYALDGVYTLDGNTVWATGGTRGLPVSDSYAIVHKTTDAGQHWTTHHVEFHDPPLDFFLGISAGDADTAWAVGGNSTVAKTTDGGAHWTRDLHGFGGLGDANEVCAVSASTVWVATDDSIYWSTDGGDNWDNGQNHGLPGNIAYMDVCAVSGQEAWASHASYYGSICHTTDGGTTWTELRQLDGEDLPSLWTISFATQPIPEPSTLVMLGPGGLFLMWFGRRRK